MFASYSAPLLSSSSKFKVKIHRVKVQNKDDNLIFPLNKILKQIRCRLSVCLRAVCCLPLTSVTSYVSTPTSIIQFRDQKVKFLNVKGKKPPQPPIVYKLSSNSSSMKKLSRIFMRDSKVLPDEVIISNSSGDLVINASKVSERSVSKKSSQNSKKDDLIKNDKGEELGGNGLGSSRKLRMNKIFHCNPSKDEEDDIDLATLSPKMKLKKKTPCYKTSPKQSGKMFKNDNVEELGGNELGSLRKLRMNKIFHCNPSKGEVDNTTNFPNMKLKKKSPYYKTSSKQSGKMFKSRKFPFIKVKKSKDWRIMAEEIKRDFSTDVIVNFNRNAGYHEKPTELITDEVAGDGPQNLLDIIKSANAFKRLFERKCSVSDTAVYKKKPRFGKLFKSEKYKKKC